MIYRWTEFEDWVEFYSRDKFRRTADGTFETIVNFGGPGSATAYHFYARVTAGAEKLITAVTVDGASFTSDGHIVAIAGTPGGFQWVRLGSVTLRRDYRRVTLAAEGLEKLERLAVIEIPDRLESGEVERRIAHEQAGPEPASGVPLGGVGAGKIELCRDGLFRNITINGNIDTPIWRTEGSFFAVRAEANGSAQARILSTEGLHGLTPFPKIEFHGLYPRGRIRAADRDFPLTVDLWATGTVIPHNIKDSALPLALFRVRLTAPADSPVKATVAFCMENFLGRGGTVASPAQRQTFDQGYYHLWDERDGNVESPWRRASCEGLLFDGPDKEEKRSEGRYVLAAHAPVSSRLTGWRFEQDSAVWRHFAESGAFPVVPAQPSKGEKTAGAIAVAVDLAAGETQEVRFAFAWYVPHFWQGNEIDYGHYYCNDFTCADEVAIYGLENFDRLESEAAAVPDLLLRSGLPGWLARSLANDAYVFSTASWLTKDGRFAINEGPSHMFGCMGTLDQKLYASHYHTLFFPELDRTELLDFARSQGDDGSIQHDLGYGHLEQKGKGHYWPDLSSAFAILSLKHYQMTGDEAYIDEVYPRIVKALLTYQRGLDTDGDGIANISGVGNTFDSEKYEGTSSYIASMWLCALAALEELARRRGDDETSGHCAAAFAKAKKSAIEELFNGEFFVNYYDTAQKRRCPNSHISQVAGEFFARLLDIGPLYGDEYVRKALASILRLNYHKDLAFPTNEATPEGKMPYRKLWGWLPHARVYLGATPMYFGMAEAGLDALERMENVLVGINKDNRWDQRLFYEPDTGKEHWGRFYMSAPATWYAYQALLGFSRDKPRAVLGIVPNLPESLLPFEGPLFLPEFWGWLAIDASNRTITLKVIKRFSEDIAVRRLRLPAWEGTLTLKADETVIACKRADADEGGPAALYDCAVDLSDTEYLALTFG